MCRSTDFQRFYYHNQHRLKIKSFFVRFSNLADNQKQLPESLTLVYLPRINETPLEISGKSVRPHSPAFVTLHRVVSAGTSKGEGIYGSREGVVASEGVTFEVYLGEEKVVKGTFRKDAEEEWKLECRSVVEREIVAVDHHEVAVAEICVGVEGHVAMIERVEMVVKKRGRCSGGVAELDEIPEESEMDVIESDEGFESEGCCCSCGEEVSKSDGEDDINTEGVAWAVDVGIWVVCLGLGVGYLVSKASSKALRSKTIFSRAFTLP